MKSSTQTQAELDSAHHRLLEKTKAVEQLEANIAGGDRATIRAARDQEDELRGALNEAQLALDQAEVAHAAAVKAERLSRLAAIVRGVNEVPIIFDKKLEEIARISSSARRLASECETLVRIRDEQAQEAAILAAEIGEPVDLTPFSLGLAQARALARNSAAEGASYYVQGLLNWLGTATDPVTLNASILRLTTGRVHPPDGVTPTEAAELILQTGDPSAPSRLSYERAKPFRDLQAAIETERQALAKAKLTRAEEDAYYRLTSGTLEERIEQVTRARREQQAAAFAQSVGAA